MSDSDSTQGFENFEKDSDSDSNNDSNQGQGRTPSHIEGSGGDADLASLEENTIQRDENGEIIPRREYVEEIDSDVLVKPLPSPARERFIEETIGSGEDLTNAQLAELFDEYYVHPDFTNHPDCPDDHVSEQFVKDGLTGAQEDAYFFGVLLACDEHALLERLRTTKRGGMDEAQLKVLKELGPEKMEELAEQAGVGEGQGQGN